MFLEFNLPVRINLSVNEKEIINNTSINFNYENYNCFLKLKSEEDIKENTKKEKIYYTRLHHAISIMIEDNNKGAIENFVKEKSMMQILKLINSISNRCLLVFRNYGNLTTVKEFSLQLDIVDEVEFKSFFMMLDVKISKNNEEYEKILEHWGFKIDFAEEFISRGSWLQKGYFNVYDEEYLNYDTWSDIKNALENNSEVTEERIFYVNSLEHTKNNNIRLAVIETVIGLEIVVTKYLRNYLKFKNIPNDRIGNLINSHIGIYSMVSVLLDLSVEEEIIKYFEIDKVLKLINLRNDIIHENYKIPKETTKQKEIIEQIIATQILCKLLFSYCNKIIIIKSLLEKTKKSYDIENIEVRCMPDTPTIILGVYLKKYSNELITKINFSIISSLKDFRKYEKLYDEKEYLYISYRFNKEVMAKFSNGKLVFLNQ
jgi:hypothetical protein